MRYARGQSNDVEETGQDAFLDIVANMVGILILLVMVVGVRAARRPAASAPVEPSAEQQIQQPEISLAEPPADFLSDEEQQLSYEEHHRVLQETDSLYQQLEAQGREILKFSARLKEVRGEIKLQDDVRVQLATVVQTTRERQEASRAELDEDRREEYDTQLDIKVAQERLGELTRAEAAALAVETEVVTIESIPTAIAKKHGPSDETIYLHIEQGRVAFVPLEALREEIFSSAESLRRTLSSRDTATRSAARGGFRLALQLQKQRVRGEFGSRTRVASRMELIPSPDLIAEPVDEAVQDGAALTTELVGYPPRSTFISIFAYNDSFSELRLLRQHLNERGYRVSIITMESGEPVVWSSEGRRELPTRGQ